MSFSEYNGSKTKVSHTVTRILRNAQENLPRIQSQGGSVGALLKSFSNGGSKTKSERLNKPSSPQTSKFGFQKLRLGLEKKRTNGSRHHAELLDNQDDGGDEEQESGDEEPGRSHHFNGNNQFPKASLIGPPNSQYSPNNQKEKRWPF